MAQSCDKCTSFFVIDLPFYNFFEDVWPFVKEVNFRPGLLLRILDDTVKLTYMMNSVNDKDYTQLESVWCGRKVMRMAMLCMNRQGCCLPLHMAVRLTPAIDSAQV